jgi:hypothetical protein
VDGDATDEDGDALADVIFNAVREVRATGELNGLLSHQARAHSGALRGTTLERAPCPDAR